MVIVGSIFLITKSFLLLCFLSLVLDKYSLTTATRQRPSSSDHLSGWLGWTFIAPSTGWRVTFSAVSCIAPGVILSRFRSDGLLTMVKARIITILRVSLAWFMTTSLPQKHQRSMTLASQVSAHTIAGGFLLNIPLRSCCAMHTEEAIVCSVCCRLHWHACSAFHRSNHGWPEEI